MQSYVFEVFLAFLALSRIKWFKLSLFGTKLSTQYNLLYFIVFKWLESKTIDICMKLHAKLRFWGCLAFFAFSRIKWCKLVLFGTKLGTQHYLVYVIVFKWLEWKMNIHMLEITCLVAFFRLFYRFWHFSNKVVQTWFI